MKITDKQKNEIERLAQLKFRTTDIQRYIHYRFGVKSIDDLSYEQARKTLDYLEFCFTDFDDF